MSRSRLTMLTAGGVVLFVVLVVIAATADDGDDGRGVVSAVTETTMPTREPLGRGPALGDHWHAAFGIFECGDFLPPPTDVRPDQSGIHSHGDGLIHIHPFSAEYTDDGANLAAFADQVGIDLDGMREWECGGEAVDLRLLVWSDPEDDEPAEYTDDIESYAPADGEVLVLALAPDDDEVPMPPSVVNLVDPQAAERGEEPEYSGDERGDDDAGVAMEREKPDVRIPDGPVPDELVVLDDVEGSGDEVALGDTITVHYVGVRFEDGSEFDSSWDRGEPATFDLVEGGLIEGWVSGLPGMREGGRRTLVIPGSMAYGDEDRGDGAPYGALVFVIDLISIQSR